MSKITAAITAVGAYVPDYVLTNDILATMVDTNDEWIQSRPGISERRILKGEGLGTSDMAKVAVEQLLEKTNTKPEEIELLLCATVTPDMVFPATANIISDKTNLSNAASFDVGAACSGFMYALSVGKQFIENNTYKKVIVVGADKMSSIVDYTDRATCVLFGDGAGAVLLELSEDTEIGIKDIMLKADGSGRHYLHQKAGGSVKPASLETVKNKEHFIFQDGGPVFKFAVTRMADIAEEMMLKHKLKGDDIAWLVPHQANKRIIQTVASMLDFPIEKVMVNIENYGNTTAGTLPLALSDYESQLRVGDKLILTAFGGGFTWGSTYLTWAYNGAEV